MNNPSLDIVIPIYNEGEKIIELFKKFDGNIKTNFRVLLCYDNNNDDVFDYKDRFNVFKFEIVMVKNPSTGPSAAIKEGLNYGNSECMIVYPADDLINFNIIG